MADDKKSQPSDRLKEAIRVAKDSYSKGTSIPDALAHHRGSLSIPVIPGLQPSMVPGIPGVGQHSIQHEIQSMSERFSRMQYIDGFGFWEWNLEKESFRVFPGNLWDSMGYKEKDIDRVKAIELAFTLVHENDKDKLRKCLSDHFSNNTKYSAAYRMRNRDGSYRWVQAEASSIRDKNNRVIYFAGVNYDITEEKKIESALRDSQARFRRILESSNDGVWEWNTFEKKLSYSQGCWAMLGFPKKDSDMGRGQMRRWLERIHPEDRDQVESEMIGKLNKFQPFDIEYRILNNTNDWMWLRTRGDVLTNSEGEVEFMSGANVDITELKRSEARIIKAKTLAESANRAKSEFLSSMSHELRTPMNAILGFTQLFDTAKNLTTDQKENISEIRRAGNQLLRLINNVLELSKIEAGKASVSIRPVPIHSVIEEVFSQCTDLAKKSSVSLNFEPHHLKNAFVRADRASLKQSLIKLVSNGVIYNRSGGRVIVSLVETANKFLVISVRDTGRGIPKSVQANLFEPFSQQQDILAKPTGNGVGLVICKKLVELMGGNIEFDSEEGAGSCFQIQLPIEKNVVDDSDTSESVEISKFLNFDNQLFKDKTVLFVDDDSKCRNWLGKYFKNFQGLKYETADEGIKGLFKARSLLPHVIFYDLHMPGIDGYEVIKILKSDPNTRNIPVVALSEIHGRKEIQSALEAGFSDLLPKPLDVEQLTVVTSQLVND